MSSSVKMEVDDGDDKNKSEKSSNSDVAVGDGNDGDDGGKNDNEINKSGDMKIESTETGEEKANETEKDDDDDVVMENNEEKEKEEDDDDIEKEKKEESYETTSKKDGSGEAMDQAQETSTTASTSVSTRPSKKRPRSPETEDGDTKESTAATASSSVSTQQLQQAAVSAASAQAAASLCATMGFSGLYSLLSATVVTTTGATASSSSTSAGSASGGGGSGNHQNVLPTAQQVHMAASKAIQDCPPFVHLSKTDSAPQLKVIAIDEQSPRRLTVKGGMRGYRMSRATHGTSSGTYYYEALILKPPSVSEIVAALPPNTRMGKRLQEQMQQALLEERKNTPEKEKTSTFGGHVRLGWSMRTGDLQAPVGYDKWSFGIRDIGGSKIHCSKRDDSWGGEGFGPGDVIGCMICLPDKTKTKNGDDETTNAKNGSSSSGNDHDNNKKSNDNNNNSKKKNDDDGDDDDDNMHSSTKRKNNDTGIGTNHIRFFKNGLPMGQFVISKGKREGGAAFTNIPDGVYYPAISLYMGASVRVNPGPHFICPPKKLPTGLHNKFLPVSDLCPKPISLSDALGKLQKEKIFRKPEMSQKFQELIQSEVGVVQNVFQTHRRKHLQEVLEERMKRNLSTTDLESDIFYKVVLDMIASNADPIIDTTTTTTPEATTTTVAGA